MKKSVEAFSKCRLLQKQYSIVQSDEGAEGYGIVVFEAVTTIPYPPAGGRWNIVTDSNFETASKLITIKDYAQQPYLPAPASTSDDGILCLSLNVQFCQPWHI